MKAKSFHCSKSGVVQPLAASIGTNLHCVCDKMPPAYPCDKDKVVYIGIEMDGKVPHPVEQFVKDLDKARTTAVAFYIVNGNGNTAGLEGLEKMLASKDIVKAGETLSIICKSSFFKKGQVTDADVAKVLEWSQEIAAMKF
ncbi:MAG: hypothetical protein R3Y33_08640 [Clostridia bacterium]